MGTKIKEIDALNIIRANMEKIMAEGLAEIKKKYTAPDAFGNQVELTGWKAMRVVIVLLPNNVVKCCARANKPESSVEIMMLRKDLELIDGNITPLVWDRIIGKFLTWLRKRSHDKKLPWERYDIKKQSDLFDCKVKNGIL